MRKSLILMLIATLLVGAFLVSCNSDITSESSNGDKLVKVTIAGNSKGISAIAGGDDADNYFWYYKASKNDTSVYRTGETVARTGDGTTESPYTNGAGGWTPVKKDSNGAIAGLSGADLGYFSTGDWLFSFAGFTEKVTFDGDTATGSSQTAVTSAYYQSNLSVGVTAETHITVTLTAGTGLSGTATLVFAEELNWVYTPENDTNTTATLAALSGKSAYMLVYTSEATDATPIAQSVPVNVGENGSVTFTAFAPYNSNSVPSEAARVTVPASVDGTDYTFYFKVFVNNGTAYEEVGKTNTQSAKAYSNGTIAITKTGNVAVVDNESIKKVYIDGSYLPEIGAYSAKGSKEITVNSTTSTEVVFETAITPVSTEVTTVVDPQATDNKKTTVSFPAGSFVDSGATTDTAKSIEMEVVIYKTEEAATNSTFTVSGGNTFAGLDLSVDLITTTIVNQVKTTTTESVSSFNYQEVTVTTYIAKGLTSVTVANGGGTTGDAPTFVSYDAGTGKLVFKTNHFSEFAVGADQNVYDKTTNTGYIIASTGENKGKYVTDKNGTTLQTANLPSSNDELLLLKSELANVVDDAYDAFNAGYKWSVVHTANEAAPAEGFAGGYGTKVEPYIVNSYGTMQKISTLYSSSNDRKTNYFKVDGSTETIDCNETGTGWISVNLLGSFNGNNVQFINLDKPLFCEVNNAGSDYADNAISIKNFSINANIVCGNATALVEDLYCSHMDHMHLIIDSVNITGYIEGSGGASSFIFYGPYYSGTTDSLSNPSVIIKNCISSATIVATGDNAAGFIKHGAAAHYKIEDSLFLGALSDTRTSRGYFSANNTKQFKGTVSYSDGFLSSNGINSDTELYTYPTNGSLTNVEADMSNWKAVRSSTISKESTNMSGNEYGNVISTNKAPDAKKAIVTLWIAPNDTNDTGAYLGCYMTEEIDLSALETGAAFNTIDIRRFNVEINGTTAVSTITRGNSGYSANSTVYNVLNSAYGHTHNGAYIKIVQYSANGTILKIEDFNI